MAILFADDFDGEAEGTSPPANWTVDTSQPPSVNEVDDAQYVSAPHSMKMNGVGGVYRNFASGFSTDKISMRKYFTQTTVASEWLSTQSTEGESTSGNIAIYMSFSTNGNIFYHDGSWVDTGYNYSTGWHLLEYVHDLASNTFDAWYDGTKIITAGGYFGGHTGLASIKQVEIYVNIADIWVDDVQIGEATGSWSDTINGVSTPANVNGVAAANINNVNGVS